MPGLTRNPCDSVQDCLDILNQGNKKRTVASTEMNKTSSRSHACLTIYLKRYPLGNEKAAVSSKFNLVDLAGSESLGKTKAVGERAREGCKINAGLLALGNVINQLSTSKNQHVSYRDSKLTRLLQDSLGGNAHTLMIACISPADFNWNESINTLRYADRARKIKNVVSVNIDEREALIIKLKEEIASLRTSSASPISSEERRKFTDQIKTLQIQNARLENTAEEAQSRSTKFLSYLAECRRRAQLFESQYGKFLEKVLDMSSHDPDDEEELHDMLVSLKDLQKILFSLHCADPKTDIKEDTISLFDSIISSQDSSPVKPMIMPTINEDSDCHTGSEKSLPVSPSFYEKTDVAAEVIDPPNKKFKVEFAEAQTNTSFIQQDISMSTVLKKRLQDLERDFEKEKCEKQKQKQLLEMNKIKLRTIEAELKEKRTIEQNLKRAVAKNDRILSQQQRSKEEIAKLKLIRVAQQKDQKLNENRWRLKMKEKEKVLSNVNKVATKSQISISKLTRQLEQQKNINQRKTVEAQNAIKKLREIQNLGSMQTRSAARRKPKFSVLNFQDLMMKFISIKKATGMIEQLRNLRKQDKEMLDQVMNATFDQADEDQVMEERTKLERQIEKNTNLLLELQQEVDSMGSLRGIQEKLMSMAQTGEEKDQLLVFLLTEMETQASQQTLERINLDATRDHVKQLTEDLEEVDDAMQVMKDAYFSRSKKRLSRSVASVKKLEVTFQQALQVEPRLSPNPSPKRKRSVKQPLLVKNKHNIIREFPPEFTYLLEDGCIQKMNQDIYKTVKLNFELFQFLSQTAVKEYQRFDNIYIEETRKFSPKSREIERQHRNQELKMNVRASGAMERMKRENSPMLEKLKLTPIKGSLSRLKDMDLEAKSREQNEANLEKKDDGLEDQELRDKENLCPRKVDTTGSLEKFLAHAKK